MQLIDEVLDLVDLSFELLDILLVVVDLLRQIPQIVLGLLEVGMNHKVSELGLHLLDVASELVDFFDLS